jgi:hypothetical protein
MTRYKQTTKAIPPTTTGISYRHYVIKKIVGNFAIILGREIICTQPTEREARVWVDRRVEEASRSNNEGSAA